MGLFIIDPRKLYYLAKMYKYLSRVPGYSLSHLVKIKLRENFRKSIKCVGACNAMHWIELNNMKMSVAIAV